VKIPLTKAWIEKDDEAELVRAARRQAIGEGATTRRFEEQFARFLGLQGAVATNSCTSALVLALRALGADRGGEVILPSYTCLAVLNAVSQVGATARLVDNRYDPPAMDYNLTPDLVRPQLTPRTRAIIVPHMFGVPAPIDDIVALGVPVIEDITLSLGARQQGRLVGSVGAIAVCSFHESKMIACGEGGMLATSNPDLLERARYLNSWEAEQAGDRFRDDYPPYETRYNFHMSELQAALGLSQLAKLEDFLERRAELARRYGARLSTIDDVVLPQGPAGRGNVFFRYLVALRQGDVVPVLRAFLDVGIEAGRGVFPPLHKVVREPDGGFPGAERATKTLISIPLYPALTDDEVSYILERSVELLAHPVA